MCSPGRRGHSVQGAFIRRGVRGERKLEVCVKVRAECRRKTYKNTATRKVSQIKH